jgi:Tfp pilus assembly protein PilF
MEVDLDEASKGAELVRRSYLDEEINQIYELGRLWLENGDLKGAEVIMNGLVEVAPQFAPAWLGLCLIQTQAGDIDAATKSAKRAHNIEPESVEAILFLTACLLTIGDYSRAGTFLGEIAEKVDSGAVADQNILRFYRAQLARYENR